MNALDKMQPLLMKIVLGTLGIQGTYLYTLKTIYSKTTANILLNGEKVQIFPLKSGTRQGYPLSSSMFNIVLVFLVRAIRLLKEMKGYKLDRKKSRQLGSGGTHL